jgi:hypothetical protein
MKNGLLALASVRNLLRPSGPMYQDIREPIGERAGKNKNSPGQLLKATIGSIF